MYQPRHRDRQPRRGVILLVVVTLLTLFAVVGISFVLYAGAQASSAKLAREAETIRRPDLEPETALAFFMNQLLYDVRDDPTGVYSSLRGQSLCRNMFGGAAGSAAPNIPFSGAGRVHYTYTGGGIPPVLLNQDDYYLVNYTFFANDGFLRTPEALGLTSTRVTSWNPSYTYPDLNNLFLAAVGPDPSNNTVDCLYTPSFHRRWLFQDLSNIPTSGNPGNPNWLNGLGKYLTLRPRPVDHLTQADIQGAGLPWPLNLDALTPAQRNILIALIAQKQAEGKLFPYPEDAGGDVKNLHWFETFTDPFTQKTCAMDSIWLDLDAPVMTAPDGRKFKPLFAPLILDLDGRVNVNIHGNIRGAGDTHVSNQGWGPWEVSLASVFTTTPGELPNLFKHSLYGKYQNPLMAETPPKPTSIANIPGGASAHFHAPVDFDGCAYVPANGFVPISGPLQPPTAGNGNVYTSFPSLPAGGGYDNGNTGGPGGEKFEHPALYSYFNPTSDRRFNLSNMEALLRLRDTGGQALTSELFRVCPSNFANARIRRLVTTDSFALSRSALSPWVWDKTDATKQFKITGTNTYPTGLEPILYGNSTTLTGGTPPATGEYSGNWTATTAGQGLANVNSFDPNNDLKPYPALPMDFRITDIAGFTAAQTERQELAKRIFKALRDAVGARDPAPPASLNPEEYNGLRWLAQLAVNMVDYIDEDDYITPFNWNTTQATDIENGWVFGTELPRIVLNEVYAELSNDPTDPFTGGVATLPYHLNFWVELHNPVSTDNLMSESGNGRLYLPASGANPVIGSHKIVIVRNPPERPFREVNNVLGSPTPVPDPAMPPPPPRPVRLEATSFTPAPGFMPKMGVDPSIVLPGNGAYKEPNNGGNQGFYVIGPSTAFPGTDPTKPTPTLQLADPPTPVAADPTMDGKDGLRYRASFTDVTLATPPSHTVMLRRLACPHLPPNEDPANTTTPFNPYVTVDYVDGVVPNVSATNSDTGANMPVPVDNRYSYGRFQPYQATLNAYNNVGMVDRRPILADGTVGRTGQPQHTFFRHNAREDMAPPSAMTANQTMKIPFDWLVHLDRKVISPIELMHVSGGKPHELTQDFIYNPSLKQFGHTVRWYDQTNRLYRAFAFLKTNEYGGFKPDALGRIPGKININTVWDPEVFQALCAANSGNLFNSTAVSDLFRKILESRSGDPVNNKFNVPGLSMVPGTDDRPFHSLATPYTTGDAVYPSTSGGGGMKNTLLRNYDPNDMTYSNTATPAAGRLFDVRDYSDMNTPHAALAHPYQRMELLTKIYNNLSTTSNVFAVWVTVGFFEVRDDTVRPVKLGAEMNRSEGRHVRHRMFAIVDRSVLENNPGPQPRFDLRAKTHLGVYPAATSRLVPYFTIID